MKRIPARSQAGVLAPVASKEFKSKKIAASASVFTELTAFSCLDLKALKLSLRGELTDTASNREQVCRVSKGSYAALGLLSV